jgi:hypothetical protein
MRQDGLWPDAAECSQGDLARRYLLPGFCGLHSCAATKPGLFGQEKFISHVKFADAS